ncbi:hypothetical protein [Streptomyces fulvoviolaceus]|uniref:hypothetical protein n=1 Tax=Streptomyces fulvoviolaceus TaxID=285535 RepID=UPI00131ACF92|nr:hypothetical protein [Streptomyces fulvoviolaceus]MCT9084723.1 hypothetical protein [Streptomyces fulvoviolaceus]
MTTFLTPQQLAGRASAAVDAAGQVGVRRGQLPGAPYLVAGAGCLSARRVRAAPASRRRSGPRTP